ncbi:D-hexose-6-phosphate mutarotase [Colwellia sp. 75C3]|uniref:D-hexose-6-phosphate mutarotase n=1 Tax=Colwellia sp. 75C3 TaxID=888425 RepID=UPI000C3407F6|nr:D-hexose-6-phosphate mutarotase [Colwellia sp. 75C3]PKG85831.1 D-hexose-6-phosphate mutarotase [Colwellia sp. 75C3]
MTKILLDNDFTQVTSIKLSQSSGTECFEGLSISHAHCQAQISLHGGQVLSFKPTGHKDVLWLSEQAYYQSGKAIRGGIPLCWPWFGANDKQTEKIKAASHGFARQLPWEIASVEADEQGVTLVLVLAGENQHPLWPNAYKLTQTLFFGKSLKQSLAMSNLSQEDAQYSAALHSYFTVSNPNNVSLDALTGVSYSDKLTGNSSIQQQAVSCVGEIDREYHSNEKMTLVDSQWQRKIDIVSRNCQQWVLWNPGAELANTMADIHPQGEQEYVCLEAANTSWQALPAGKTVIISQEISVTNF